MENKAFNIFVGLLTIVALFASDFNYSIFTNQADSNFDIVFIICIIVFSFEVIASIFVKTDYLFTFFFYLDILSTVTILFDLSSVNNSFLKYFIFILKYLNVFKLIFYISNCRKSIKSRSQVKILIYLI